MTSSPRRKPVDDSTVGVDGAQEIERVRREIANALNRREWATHDRADVADKEVDEAFAVYRTAILKHDPVDGLVKALESIRRGEAGHMMDAVQIAERALTRFGEAIGEGNE